VRCVAFLAMLAVVSTSYRESDLIDTWIQHTLSEGADLILVADKMAPDGTRDILENWADLDERVVWFDDDQDAHRQSWWTERLADIAHECGATWICPLDVDEFVYATHGGTVANAIAEYPGSKLFMRVWQHLDWTTRYADHHRMPKCCYRWEPDVRIEMGAHNVSVGGGEYDVLDIRELKYRNFEHYVQKIADRNATLEPAARSRGDGAHHLWLENKGRQELEIEWQKMLSVQTIADPIPSHANRG